MAQQVGNETKSLSHQKVCLKQKMPSFCAYISVILKADKTREDFKIKIEK